LLYLSELQKTHPTFLFIAQVIMSHAFKESTL
jgi:hypothetical protein